MQGHAAASSAKPIAILTGYGYDDDKALDTELVDQLISLGFAARSVVWKQKEDWKNYCAVLIRSTWDYSASTESHALFLQVLHDMEAAKIPIFNPLSVISWNSNKRYLLELQKHNVSIMDTIFLTREKVLRLHQEVATKSWSCDVTSGWVIKPSISGSGKHTERFTLANAEEKAKKMHSIDTVDVWIVQPFAREIKDEGEWSFVFIDGQYEHTVLSAPARDNFLVQSMHGGRAKSVKPDEELLQQAKDILACAHTLLKQTKEPLLYARVDCIRRGTRLVLMELELIEPFLFQEFAPNLAANLARALLARLKV